MRALARIMRVYARGEDKVIDFRIKRTFIRHFRIEQHTRCRFFLSERPLDYRFSRFIKAIADLS